VSAVVQRVTEARVTVDDGLVGEIARGVVVLVGVAHGDAVQQSAWLADKVANLRIFSDPAGRMNLSLLDVGGEALVVSQFTLYGDARRGRRPSFVRALRGPEARALYEEIVASLEELGVRCRTGRFGASMQVTLTNDGPVTIVLDSDKVL
jgi:D-aminoacyl-tRNA deacylase